MLSLGGENGSATLNNDNLLLKAPSDISNRKRSPSIISSNRSVNMSDRGSNRSQGIKKANSMNSRRRKKILNDDEEDSSSFVACSNNNND